MGWEWAFDLVKLGVYVACAYAVFHAVARRGTATWTRRRLTVLGVLTLVVVGTKVIEDVLAQESGPVDESLMWLLREHVPAALHGFFAAVTFGGSAAVLGPLALAGTAALSWAGRRTEAWLMGGSAMAATLVGWTLKALVGRERPTLWETASYWGSSFPSGHTLNAAAVTTAAALCVARIWPRAGRPAMVLALLWTALVALSRLVLGVHWPSDVLAAFCIGAFIPLAAGLAVTSRGALSGDGR